MLNVPIIKTVHLRPLNGWTNGADIPVHKLMFQAISKKTENYNLTGDA
jgi:hypothetical protein